MVARRGRRIQAAPDPAVAGAKADEPGIISFIVKSPAHDQEFYR